MIVTGQGLLYLHIPVDWKSPTVKDFTRFTRIFAGLQDHCLLVHCAKNMRVSAFIYLYRVTKQGIDHETACTDLNQIWIPSDQWHHLLNRIRSDHGLDTTDFPGRPSEKREPDDIVLR